MFHFHKWEKIRSGVCTAQHTSILFKQNWDEDATIIIEQCKKCLKERAFMIDMYNKKSEITVEYANSVLRYVPYNPF